MKCLFMLVTLPICVIIFCLLARPFSTKKKNIVMNQYMCVCIYNIDYELICSKNGLNHQNSSNPISQTIFLFFNCNFLIKGVVNLKPY